jgi:hypothetical protein
MDAVEAIRCAELLRRSHPTADSLAALDAVLGEVRLTGDDAAHFGAGEALTEAEKAFVASAFIRGIYEYEFLAWQQPLADPRLREYVGKVWTGEVVGSFLQRYTASGPLKPLRAEERVRGRWPRML